MPAQIRIEKSDNVTRHQKDWLGCSGNTWAPVKVMPGTCPACVWGDGEHAADCAADVRALPTRTYLNALDRLSAMSDDQFAAMCDGARGLIGAIADTSRDPRDWPYVVVFQGEEIFCGTAQQCERFIARQPLHMQGVLR